MFCVFILLGFFFMRLCKCVKVFHVLFTHRKQQKLNLKSFRYFLYTLVLTIWCHTVQGKFREFSIKDIPNLPLGFTLPVCVCVLSNGKFMELMNLSFFFVLMFSNFLCFCFLFFLANSKLSLDEYF